MCVSVFYIRAFQLVSLSLSLSFYLFLYSLSLSIYISTYLSCRDPHRCGRSFHSTPPPRSLDNLALSLRFDLRVVDFPNEIIMRSEPGQKELFKFLFSRLDHFYDFIR